MEEAIPAPERQKVIAMLKKFSIAAVGAAVMVLGVPAYAVDADAALALARQNNCLKCHAIDKDKDGPSYKKVAEKYKGKSDAEAKLINHLTSGEKAKFPDGHEEEHKIVKTSPPKDMAQIKNLVQWILSQ
jgi:cytochrome c